ncbi:serine protease [Methylobacterium nodulans]|uniref:Peptidoglycan-binding domain 1 protein n=1 Tax=Methylobacterium nodulans (strain LMG 21967 / CNCM I-2342 / ORS 2060) TaxID=460265 RepID=B8IR25_METNO|nr:serine protease [Methylobacterium nodulans]ACL56727.1 Peptidoglycan-binding domain 1 protein [Methylobacterium nodulans ORS 2060]
MPRCVSLLLAAGLILTVSPGSAQAPPPRPAPPVAKPADPAFEAARAAFEARPEDERKAVQDALVWVSDYNSVTSGTFGRRTFEALSAWQAQSGIDPTGILDDRARARLLAAGQAARQAARFTLQTDAATGITLGVPERLLAKRARIPNGSRWQSADGRVTLDTKGFAPGETDLDALFEKSTAATPERKVTYKLKKPDFVVVTGETATGKFYIRYAAAPAGIRGFTLAYDKAIAREVDRLVIAVANSFSPFPAEAAVAAAPRLPAAAPRPPAPEPAAASPAAPVGTGLAVGPQRLVTAASIVARCPTPLIGGAPARVVRQEAGLALVEVDRPLRGGALPPAAPAAPAPGDDLVVLGASREGGPSVAPGAMGPSGGVIAPLQPGAAGGPALDRAGRLVGLVAMLPAQPRLIAGVMPPMMHPLIGIAALRGFLNAEGVTLEASSEAGVKSTGAIAAPLAGAIVPVQCRS